MNISGVHSGASPAQNLKAISWHTWQSPSAHITGGCVAAPTVSGSCLQSRGSDFLAAPSAQTPSAALSRCAQPPFTAWGHPSAGQAAPWRRRPTHSWWKTLPETWPRLLATTCVPRVSSYTPADSQDPSFVRGPGSQSCRKSNQARGQFQIPVPWAGTWEKTT